MNDDDKIELALSKAYVLGLRECRAILGDLIEGMGQDASDAKPSVAEVAWMRGVLLPKVESMRSAVEGLRGAGGAQRAAYANVIVLIRGHLREVEQRNNALEATFAAGATEKE